MLMDLLEQGEKFYANIEVVNTEEPELEICSKTPLRVRDPWDGGHA